MRKVLFRMVFQPHQDTLMCAFLHFFESAELQYAAHVISVLHKLPILLGQETCVHLSQDLSNFHFLTAIKSSGPSKLSFDFPHFGFRPSARIWKLAWERTHSHELFNGRTCSVTMSLAGLGIKWYSKCWNSSLSFSMSIITTLSV